jgi:hypothetical protein
MNAQKNARSMQVTWITVESVLKPVASVPVNAGRWLDRVVFQFFLCQAAHGTRRTDTGSSGRIETVVLERALLRVATSKNS